MDERSHRPTSKGFANAFSTYDGPLPSLSSSASAKREGGRKDRDPESNDEINAGYRTRILNANWRDVTTDAKSTIGKPRDQLEPDGFAGCCTQALAVG